MEKKYYNRIVDENATMMQSLKLMDEKKTKVLLVFSFDKFLGILTIGDIQRAIIANLPMSTRIREILDPNKYYASAKDSIKDIRAYMLSTRTECMPVLDQSGDLLEVYFWEDFFDEEDRTDDRKIDIPVVIMAGGKGTRMKPLTYVIPKPLIPIDNKTIIEHIIDNFMDIGCNRFYCSVNYKADMIENYFENLEKNYMIDFFLENKPLGTAGSLHLLNGKIKSTFFISNCDILIQEDYIEIYNYHRQYKNELTIVGSFRHYPIPYGTLETGEDGQLLNITEKPELSFLINSGMYILEPYLIEEIPKNEFFHMTDLIEKIKKRNGRVGVFPVSEKSWKDIGEWNQYINMIRK